MSAERPAGLKRKLAFGGLAFLLLVLIITSVFGRKGLIEISRLRKEYAALVAEIERLKVEKGRLEAAIAELEKNPQAVERDAREKLWLMGPDEKVIIKKAP